MEHHEPENHEKRRSKKKGMSAGRIVLIVLLALIVAGAIFALKFFSDISNPDDLFAAASPAAQTPAPEATLAPSPTPERDPDEVLSEQADTEFMSNRTNVLVLGIDESTERESWGAFRTDTMLLVSIDFASNDVCMISVPRDSYVKIYTANGELADELEPYAKINNAFSTGGGAQKKGFEYTMTTVSKLLDVNIDYYCAFNMNVVKDVVNAMGGVDYYVDTEVTMNGRLLHVGQQHLDGQGVLDYCRQRKGSSDIARIDRQQRMLTAILEQMKSTNQIVNLPSIYTAAQSNIMTNLSFRQICSLSLVALRMDMSQLERHTIEGKACDINGRSCWCIYADRLQSLVNSVWGGNHTIDPEIDYESIQQMLLLNSASGDILTAANRTYAAATAILNSCSGMLSTDDYSALSSAASTLLSAIQSQSAEQLSVAYPAAQQLCDSICQRYGIQLSY